MPVEGCLDILAKLVKTVGDLESVGHWDVLMEEHVRACCVFLVLTDTIDALFVVEHAILLLQDFAKQP